MINNRKADLTALPKDIFTGAMVDVNVPGQATAIMGALSNLNRHFYSMFRDDLITRAIIRLSQASMDDDRDTVRRMLSLRPDLLLVDPPKNFVIESKLTWQIFYAEKPAIMAAKRKQIHMLELMLPYYDDLPESDVVREAKAQAISAWKMYEIKKITQGEDEIVISSEYLDYAKSLIDVFSEETFPNGSHNYGYGMLSEKTELALSILFNRLLPKEAVRLDDYFDVELLLLAVYQTYSNHFNTFKNCEQRHAFCIRVRGLIQSVLTPETAKIFCESLDDMTAAIKNGERKEISKEAALYKLKGGEAFYRISRDSRKGAGFNFHCGTHGEAFLLAGGLASFIMGVEILMSGKNNRLAELKVKTKDIYSLYLYI